MLTTAPYLKTRRPSPTTAEFTVTTQPPPTLTHRLLVGVTVPLRLLLLAAIILVLYGVAFPPSTAAAASEQPVPPVFSDAFIWYALARAHGSAAARPLAQLAAAAPAWAVVPACAAAAYVAVRRAHAAESLLVLRGLGIQTRSAAATYLAAPATRFIPTAKIRDVLINEAFRGFEVRHYLIVVVDGEDDVVVVFPRLLPPKHIVETVWRGVRGCLYDVDAAKLAAA